MLGPDRGGPARLGPECRPCSQPRALSGLARDRARRLRERTGRHPQTVMGWLHRYNEGGPEAVQYRRTGGRPPFAPRSKPRSVRRAALPSETPAGRGGAARSWRRPEAALDAPAAGRFCAGAVRPPVLPRDRPRRAAPARLVVEEGQEAARPCRSRAAGGLHRAVTPGIGRRPTRPAPAGLSRRGPHPPRRRSRLWMGRAWRALPRRLVLAGPGRQGLVLWPLPIQ